MAAKDLIPIVVSALSLIISAVTAYKTLFARFSGRVWPATRLVLTRIDGTPSLGLACFFENAGARPGFLDDMRLVVEHRETGATYKFFPLLMREDYNIFESYEGKDWFPFSGFSLAPGVRTERYLLFKPLHDEFRAQEGRFQVSLQSRWYAKDEWKTLPVSLPFRLTEQVAQQWNDPEAPALQVASEDVQQRRYA
jgi:hypothetical protein